MSKTFDVAIIGASLAGASLALRLSQQNISNIIIERSTFPRRKPCGEGLSILGVRELAALGIDLKSSTFPNFAYRGFQFVDEIERSKVELFDVNSGKHHGLGIQRRILDDLLLSRIQAHEQSHLLTGQEPSISELPDGGFAIEAAGTLYRSRYLVLATGTLSKLPQLLGIKSNHQNEPRCGLCVYVKSQPRHNESSGLVSVYMSADFEVCCTRVSDSLVNLSFMASQKHGRLFRPAEFTKLLPKVLDRLGLEATICDEPLGVSGIGRFARSPQTRNIFLIGDALCQLDPIGGMGMSQALVSARVTAGSLAKLLARVDQRAWILTNHRRQLKRALSDLRAYTFLSYWSLASTKGKRMIGSLRTGHMAKEILLSMHRPPSWITPSGLISRAALFSLGLL